MRLLCLLLCALPMVSSAAVVSVISVAGAPQSGDGVSMHLVRVGEVLAAPVVLNTPVGAMLQFKADSGATASLAEQSQARLDASQQQLELLDGQLAIWSGDTQWDVLVGRVRVRSRGFLRLRVCAQDCQGRPGVYGKVDGGDVTIEYLGGRLILRNRMFLLDAAGGRPEVLARDGGQLNGNLHFEAAVAAKQQASARLQSALEAFREERFDAARATLMDLRRTSPGEPIVAYYLGLIALQQQRTDDALRDLQQYAKEDPEGAAEHNIAKLLTLLTSSELQREVQRAVSQEKDISVLPPEPGSIAIQAFSSRNSPESAVLAKGIAAMVISDLSKVPGLKVLEREKVQKISDELRLSGSGLVEADSAVRVGRLLRAERVVVGNIGVE